MLDRESSRLYQALKTAYDHITCMSKWISDQQAGFSFESLGEDMWLIEQGLKLGEPREERWVDQRSDSDCLRCCLAGILRLPYETIPHFVLLHKGEWYEQMLGWLQAQGLYMMRFQGHYPHNGIYLVDGWTTRSDTHMVVFQGLDLIHVPHASKEGIHSVRTSYWILPLDAADVLT